MQHKYALPLRILHWVMAVIIIGLIALGLVMGEMERENPLHSTLYSMHKSFGVLIFILFALRLVFRMRFGAPALPDAVPELERKLGHLAHCLLYFMMVAMPVTGFLMSNYFGFGVNFFGFSIPRPVGIDKELAGFFGEAHELLANILIGLIGLHIAGVVKHWIKEKVNLLKRMV